MINYWPEVSGSIPTLRRDPRRDQHVRAMKFANVPGGKADMITLDGPSVRYVNSLQNTYQPPGDSLRGHQAFSGVLSYRKFGIPTNINRPEYRILDQFSNIVFPFTGASAPAIPIQYFSWELGTTLPLGNSPSAHSLFDDGRIAYLEGIKTYGYDAQNIGERRAVIISTDGLSGTIGGISKDPMNSASWFIGGAMCPLGDGRILRVGLSLSGSGSPWLVGNGAGSADGNVQEYFTETLDPVTLEWTQRQSPEILSASLFDDDQLYQLSVGYTLTQLADGNVIIIGGYNRDYPDILVNTGSFIYDYSSDLWTRVSDTPDARAFHTATRLLDGKILVAGGTITGSSVTNTCIIYDPSLDTWTSAASMTGYRFDHMATLLSDGKVLVCGNGDFDETYGFIPEIYDPVEDVWTVTSPITTSRSRAKLAMSNDGNAYLIGGSDSSLTCFKVVEFYNVVNGSWNIGSPLAYGHASAYNYRINNIEYIGSGTFVAFGGFDTFVGSPLSISEVSVPP